MKPETKERKLIKYVKFYSELMNAKKILSQIPVQKVQKVQKVQEIQKNGNYYFFAKIKKKNKLFLPDNAYSFIKNSGINFICLLSENSLDFVRNEFVLKTPKNLIELFRENYEKIHLIKLKKTLKIPKKAIKKLNIKANDFVLVYIYNSGFIIKKLRETDIIL